MKHLLTFFYIILLITICNPEVTAQEQTYEVVTAEGKKTTDAKQQNDEIKNRLREKREEMEQRREDKRNTKYGIKFIGKIVVGIIILGGAALWRKLKAKK